MGRYFTVVRNYTFTRVAHYSGAPRVTWGGNAVVEVPRGARFGQTWLSPHTHFWGMLVQAVRMVCCRVLQGEGPGLIEWLA
jgi:hypothetical protein